MRRKMGLFFGIAVIVGLIWYVFVRPYDYVVRFKTRASPGTINQTLKFWMGQQEGAEFLGQKNLSDFSQRIRFNDSTFTYHWQIASINDSTSRVAVYVTDNAHSITNRLQIPFSETDFEKRTKRTIKDAAKVLQEHLASFKVRVVGEDEIPSKYCACIPLKNTQLHKVTGMMDYYSTLSNFMVEHEIELDGRPMVEIENWNMQNDSITYNFCFPIVEQDSLPQQETLVYKQIKPQKGLLAIYNGNYITSDRAWYKLLEYAEEHKIPIQKNPLEIFHNNPNAGGNELEWKADIYMPLRKD